MAMTWEKMPSVASANSNLPAIHERQLLRMVAGRTRLTGRSVAAQLEFQGFLAPDFFIFAFSQFVIFNF